MLPSQIIEVDLRIYVNALFVLMFTSILTFLVVIKKINSDEIPVNALNYYKTYFILGLIGWLSLWAKDAANINIDLTVPVVFYVLVSLFLMLAIAECNRKKFPLIFVVCAHIFAVALSLLIDNDIDRIVFLATYILLAYPFVFVISLMNAIQRKNIGYGIISAACLIVLGIAPFQIYYTLIISEPGFAYGISLISSSSAYVLVGIGFLSSVLINEHKMLAQLALEDPLTGLLNRRGMDVSLSITVATEQRQRRCISVITTDIDCFKKVNDTYGHDAGDYVLKQFAYVLSDMSRKSDVCCRLGGEEFVLVLPETTSEYAIEIAERIRASIESLDINFQDQSIPLTSSFGVATHCGDIDIDYMIKDADKALYLAKSKGRNRVCVAVT